MPKITETTLIPISLLLAILGGVAYVITGFAQVTSIKERVDKIEISQERYNETVTTISDRLSTIEGALGVRKRHHGD